MKRNYIFGFIIAVLFTLNGCSEKPEIPKFNELNEPRTIIENRDAFYRDLIDNNIIANLQNELTSENEEKWRSALWAMGLANYTSEFTMLSLKKSFENFDSTSGSFKRAIIEVIYQLYPQSFKEEIKQVAVGTSNSKLFAMAVNYLIRGDQSDENNYIKLMEEKFPNWKADPILYMLYQNLSGSLISQLNLRPSLIDLLVHKYKQDTPVIFSFHRKNRDYTGITIIREAEGTFYRDGTGQIFAIPQFARSISALPGYITNGNTPQGIFSAQGIDVSQNQFIGKTPNLQLVMPFESTTKKYFHEEDYASSWSENDYKNLLPDSWKEYLPIYETFFAGKAGRTEIIAHGTTINPEYYIDQPYYPNTPSLGCITSLELWDGNTGNVIFSNQHKFISAIIDAEATEGFYVLVELDNKEAPVVIDEIISDVLRAESLIKK